MTNTNSKLQVTAKNQGLQITADSGLNNILLAFNLDPTKTASFAGFAIQITPPSGKPFWFQNRVNFSTPIHSQSTTEEKKANLTDSNLAPLQSFHIVYTPTTVLSGAYTYEVTAMYFNTTSALKAGANVKVSTQFYSQKTYPKLQIGFTGCMVSSQEYAETFQNKPFLPLNPTVDFDTKPFLPQLEWLGSGARVILFNFLEQAVKDPTITIDAMIFDIDEPDVIRSLQSLKNRLRAVFDDSRVHKSPHIELQVWKLFQTSAGAANVKFEHFQRFAHNKVLIQKKNGKPIRVLTGSMNFSLRGLYVQANNILMFDDPDVAALYSQAFEQMWSDPTKFSKSPIASRWYPIVANSGLPACSFSFSPHAAGSVPISLAQVGTCLDKATTSVHFAIMQVLGEAESSLKKLYTRNIFSYGVTQLMPPDGSATTGSVKTTTPGKADGVLVPFSYIQDHMHPPFDQELAGGSGIVIHDKFLVTDFNGSSPVVFTGSSNLAAGGELLNGDNLLMITDANIAIVYAVEATRLVDHFRFAASLSKATKDQPIVLSKLDWWKPYYTLGDEHCNERLTYSPAVK
jgi:phosphatidylserine/phosphatidylglycerophosphate/cardiolipin synthase-like enzyme